jgi:hypothetical protein
MKGKGPAVAAVISGALGCGGPATPWNGATADGGDGDPGFGLHGDDGGVATDGSGDEATARPWNGVAFPPAMGQVVDQGGGVLSAPEIVTVRWASDPDGAKWEDFDDRIGASTYWQKAVSEYGVGVATSGPSRHVVVQQDPPASWTDTDFESWMTTELSNPQTSGWPAPGAQSLYIVYIPPQAKLTWQGQDACQALLGAHAETTTSSGANVATAIVLTGCTGGQDVVGTATRTAAHELAEAATDPLPDLQVTYAGFDVEHLAWELFQQVGDAPGSDELGDDCEVYPYAYYTEGAELPYDVQRIWSNASAKAGHDPCVPAPSGAYFNTTPLDLEDVSVTAPDVTGALQTYATKGWHVAPGQSRTVRVGFYSDAPAPAWSLRVVEGSGMPMAPSPTNVLDLKLSTKQGANGDTAQLTITVKQAPPAANGTAVLVTLVSGSGDGAHYMPVIVGGF